MGDCPPATQVTADSGVQGPQPLCSALLPGPRAQRAAVCPRPRGRAASCGSGVCLWWLGANEPPSACHPSWSEPCLDLSRWGLAPSTRRQEAAPFAGPESRRPRTESRPCSAGRGSTGSGWLSQGLSGTRRSPGVGALSLEAAPRSGSPVQSVEVLGLQTTLLSLREPSPVPFGLCAPQSRLLCLEAAPGPPPQPAEVPSPAGRVTGYSEMLLPPGRVLSPPPWAPAGSSQSLAAQPSTQSTHGL